MEETRMGESDIFVNRIIIRLLFSLGKDCFLHRVKNFHCQQSFSWYRSKNFLILNSFSGHSQRKLSNTIAQPSVEDVFVTKRQPSVFVHGNPGNGFPGSFRRR